MKTSANILYLVGGVGVRADSIGRKIPSMADCWRRAGHTVRLVCGGDLTEGCREAEPASKNEADYYRKWYHRVGLMAPLVRSVSERRDIRHNAICIDRLRDLVRQDRPDLIWQRSCRLHNAGLVIARELGIPFVHEWIDNLVNYRLSWFRRRALAMEKQKNREADFVVVVSEVLREQLAAEGVDRGKILLAPNAVDPEEFRRDLGLRQEGRRRLAVADDEVLAGYLGSYAFYHDSQRLVLAAELLRRQAGAKLRILMLGDGKDYPQCRALAERLGLLDAGLLLMKPRIPKEEVAGVLAALDVAILPGSTDIICPIKIQEYMAAELPAVLPDYPANREVIVQGKTGVLFRPKDERSLADALAALAADADLRRRMGQAARVEVLTRFTWEKTWGAALDDVLLRMNTSNTTLGRQT